MKETDFGYFGSGDEGYAQYKTAFDRIFDTAGADDASDPTDDADDSWDGEDF